MTVVFATDSFRAMGCAAEVLVVGAGAPKRIAEARRMIAELEQRWSRFLPGSELCMLNAAAGRAVVVGAPTLRLLGSMVDGWRATTGAFDPTLLAPLVGLGYSMGWDHPALVSSVPAGASRRGDPAGIVIDLTASTAHVPAGTALDAGGIGKGLAADIVAEHLVAAGAEGALVSIGGDLAVSGEAPGGDGWSIAVGDSGRRVRLAQGGVATSGTERRSWRNSAGAQVHHLLDPATGRPVAGPVVEATVIAGTAAWAEVWTKAIMVNGAAVELPRFDSLGLAARVRRADGSVQHNDTWWTYAVTQDAA